MLSEAEEGKSYVVVSVYERDRQLLEFLEQRGLRPGSTVHIVSRNYDQTLALSTDEGKSSVGQPVAEKVWVRPARRG